MKKTFFYFICLICCIVMFDSCCKCGRRSSAPLDLNAVSWKLIELNGKVVPNQNDIKKFTMILSKDGEINGRGDCNSYFGRYTTPNNGEITISPDGVTKAMCPDMARETEFLEMMPMVRTFKIDGDILMLFNQDNKMIAALKKI